MNFGSLGNRQIIEHCDIEILGKDGKEIMSLKGTVTIYSDTGIVTVIGGPQDGVYEGRTIITHISNCIILD